MKIIFSHGRSGHPNGSKIQLLSKIAAHKGYTTDSIDYTDTNDADIRAARLTTIVTAQKQPFCLVGSSMGGYASLVAAKQADKARLRGIFLMAPALSLPRYQQQQYPLDIRHVEIVHGWHDETVLYEHSIRYARAANCTLHLIDDNHRLSQQTELVGELFAHFLTAMK